MLNTADIFVCIFVFVLKINFVVLFQAPVVPILRRAMEGMDTKCTAEDTLSRQNHEGTKDLSFFFWTTSISSFRSGIVHARKSLLRGPP